MDRVAAILDRTGAFGDENSRKVADECNTAMPGFPANPQFSGSAARF
jgi:hypothetical protein